jgi:hypothetical protein
VSDWGRQRNARREGWRAGRESRSHPRGVPAAPDSN